MSKLTAALDKLLDVESPEDFSARMSDAYSYKYFRNGWIPCIKMLRSRGYLDREIEDILRSKVTRWARDNSRNQNYYHTAADLARYMDANPNTIKEIIS